MGAVTDDDEAFAGTRLFELRKSAGVTQAGLAGLMRARRFRWHPTTVQRVENGARAVRLREAEALAEIFAVPLDSFRAA